MAYDLKGIAVVIMGVSGSGKSTIGEMLANVKECKFLDADDFHPESNKEKMKKGVPLTDEDRIPWLAMVRDAIRASVADGESVIVGCSALRKCYREILRSADTNYKPTCCLVKFVLLEIDEKMLFSRLLEREANGTHFMPAKLLRSQLDLLEIDESEGIYKVDATQSPDAIVSTIIQESRIIWPCSKKRADSLS